MHQRTLKCVVCTLLAATFSLVFVVAHAGETLKLKAGVQRLEAKSQMFARAGKTGGREFTGSHEYVVQFARAISEADKAQLKTAGLEIISYIPEDALVVYGDGQDVAKLALNKSEIRSIARFSPEWKLSGNFEPESIFNSEKRVRAHIRLGDSQFTQGVVTALQNTKNTDVRIVDEKVIVADVPRTEVAGLAHLPGVEWIQPTFEIRTMDYDPLGEEALDVKPFVSQTGFESGTKVMNFDAAWGRGFAGEGETVGMADTGLDSGDMSTLHKDLSNTVSAYSATFLPIFWSDTVGHGTHVAGSVQGTGAMSNGLIKGGAHHAKFIAQGVMLPFLGMLDPTALQDPNKTVGRAHDEGARIHTNSWGGDTKGEYEAMSAAYDDYTWKNPDILVIFANGNSGTDANSDGRVDEGSVGSPASAKNVLSVGASENYLLEGGIQAPVNKLKVADQFKAEPLSSDRLSDNPNGMAVFSSRGPTQDGRIKPDIVAPGTNIVAVRSSAIEPDKEDPKRPPLWGEYDANYLYCGGTSMATPLAAGAAVVARQFLAKQLGLNNPSAAVVKASLIHTAFDMYPGQFGPGVTQELPVQRPNNHEGYGRVDMDKLTQLGRETMAVDETTGVGLGEERTYTVDAQKGMVATLVYTDAPGAANAAKALVNDIDLTVVTPSGEVVTKNDHVNNVEMLELAKGAGRYTVKVKGVNIPQGKNGKQPFALLVTPN